METTQTPIREIRTFKTELRASADGEPPQISGYAAVFNSYSEDMGGWYERIAPGAFTECLAQSDIRCLINHDMNQVLGRCKAGTLTVSEDNTGLAINCTPPDTQCSRDLQANMKCGNIDQMSFAFIPADTNWDDTYNGCPVRTITRMGQLFDVSVVTYPAYPTTSASCRSAKNVFEDYQKTVVPPANSVDIRKKKLKLMEANI